VTFDQPPDTEHELLERARAIAGVRLSDLALRAGVTVPLDLRRAKGFVGQLVERALGASAGSRAGPDFRALGVELKTLPLDASGRPVESTFVCTIPLASVGDIEWKDSPVYAKLRRVLFVPVEGERERPVGERRLGEPFLWSPSAEEEADLRFDWEELSGHIGRGDVESVTGHLGRFLQVRPKASDSHSRRLARDADGISFEALPRGFYLRATFTERVVRAHFGLDH
jgi:DNA mismatch repair protein MutH